MNPKLDEKIKNSKILSLYAKKHPNLSPQEKALLLAYEEFFKTAKPTHPVGVDPEYYKLLLQHYQR